MGYDIPEEILDEIRRTAANSSPPPLYQVVEGPYGENSDNMVRTRRGHMHDVPESTTGEQIYVPPERGDIYDDVVQEGAFFRRGNLGKPDVNGNPSVHVTTPGGTSTPVLGTGAAFCDGRKSSEKPATAIKHVAETPRLTVASVGTRSAPHTPTVSVKHPVQDQKVATDSPSGKRSGSPKPSIKIKTPVQKPQVNGSVSDGDAKRETQVYDDVVAAMNSPAFLA